METNDGKTIGTDVLLDIAKELYEQYKMEVEKLPYHMNIISELHANENANSRILRWLLNYSKKGNSYPIFESFVNHVNEKCSSTIDLDIKKPVFSNEENRIDLLIKESGKYAIIIENKIWNAPDQKGQIERYVDYVIKCKIPRNKIYVVYLTKDGTKSIDDCSLTEKAKQMLNVTRRSDGRFICMNFKDDIVSWLEKTIQMDVVSEEPLLASSVTQYLDFLKECLGLRNEDKIIDNKLEKQFMDKLKLDKLSDILVARMEVDKLSDILNNTLERKINSICESKICKPLERKGYVIKAKDFNYNYFDLELEIPEWKKTWWAMESDGTQLFSGIWLPKDKTVAKKYKSMINDVFDNCEETEYIGWDYWGDNTFDDEFWEYIESHSTKFVNSIIREVERVRDATKDMKL